MVERYEAEPWLEANDALGESPRYDERCHMLRWIDIDGGARRAAPLDGSTFTSRVFEAPLGAHEMGTHTDAVAVGGRWTAVDRRTGASRQLAELGRPGMRFNDSGVDPCGRLWSGTMRADESMTGAPEGTLQVLIDGRLDTRLAGLTAGNGLAWSPDDEYLFLVDSGPDRVLRIPFDQHSTTLGEPEVWLEGIGAVDGIAMDSAGAMWIAVWGAGEVRRYGADRRLSAVIEVTARDVTAACFVGGDRRTLAITTAARASPAGLAGSVFRVNVPVPGRATRLWRGH